MSTMTTPEDTTATFEKLLPFLEGLVAMRLVRGGQERMISRARKLARKLELPINPMGNGTSKLGLMGNYRPVGLTCPSTCELLDAGCYAQYGHVSLQARRASEDTLTSLTSAAAIMLLSARYRQVARLHVSGDLYTLGDALDVPYICGLIQVGLWIKRTLNLPGNRVLAYTYTHGDLPWVWKALLEDAGIVVRRSNALEGGCIVEHFDHIPTLSKTYPEVRFTRCRAQLDAITRCSDCKLCWEKPGLTIVFEPHGSGKHHARTYTTSTHPQETHDALDLIQLASNTSIQPLDDIQKAA